MKKESIRLRDADDDGSWICICGNEPANDGFFTCDKDGNEIKPIEGGIWDGHSYVCNQCGRIIHQDTLEVAGYKSL